MQLSADLKRWLLSGKHPDPDGREAAVRRKMVARLEHLEKIDQTAYRLRGLGDVEGHEFHGNQWTDVAGVSQPERRERSKEVGVYSRASDVPHVATKLKNGEKVTADPKVAAATIEHMGTQSEHVNLEHLDVAGVENRNIFNEHATNFTRAEMPQLPEDAAGQKAFFEHLNEHGIRIKFANADPRELMAAQNELDSVKVGQIYKYVNEHGGKLRGDTGPLFISKEGAIIDGHHRWASMAAYAMTHPETRVPVAMLSAPISKAIDVSLAYGEKAGIAREDIKAGFRQPKAAAAKDDDGFAPIVVSDPPPNAPPKPDNIHPWNWVNGRWVWIPTDSADGVPPTLGLPKEKK